MTDNEYIGYKLKNDATITSYVGSGTSARIYFGFVPETVTTYPVINYFVVSYMNHENRRDRVHYQISVRSKSQDQAKKIAYAIETLFDTKQETVNSFDVQKIYWDQSNLIMEGKDIYHFAVDIYIEFIHS
jgi:hypothetical protein